MANAFAKATARAKVETKAAKAPETIWKLDDFDELQIPLADFVKACTDAKQADGTKDSAKGPLVEACTVRWIQHLVEHGARPGSTMRLVGRDGRAVTYVVKEEKLPIDDATLDALRAVIGDQVDELVTEEVSIAFDSAILTLPTVKQLASGQTRTIFSVLGERLSALFSRLVKEGWLTPEQADGLILATKRRVLKAGYLDAIAAAGQGQPETIEAGLKAIGGPKRHVQV